MGVLTMVQSLCILKNNTKENIMITYKQNPQLDFQAVLDLYASVGWTGYSSHPEMLEKALEHSLLVLVPLTVTV